MGVEVKLYASVVYLLIDYRPEIMNPTCQILLRKGILILVEYMKVK